MNDVSKSEPQARARGPLIAPRVRLSGCSLGLVMDTDFLQ